MLLQTAEAKVALLIGNDAYASKNFGSLNLAIRDTEKLASKLKELGFTVIKKKNLNKEAMNEAMREFNDALTADNEVGLFYYAGHGMQIEGENYLIPLEANIIDASEVKTKAFHADAMLNAMISAKETKINLFILDACRNNNFTGGRGGSRGLANMARKNTFIAYATQSGDIAEDDGVFMDYLSKRIAEPLPIDQMFKKVIKDVGDKTGGKQIPSYTYNLAQDFYLNGSSSRPVPPQLITEKKIEPIQAINTTLAKVDANPSYIDKNHIKNGVSVKFNYCESSKKVTGIVCYAIITALKADIKIEISAGGNNNVSYFMDKRDRSIGVSTVCTNNCSGRPYNYLTSLFIKNRPLTVAFHHKLEDEIPNEINYYVVNLEYANKVNSFEFKNVRVGN
jgi:hypothetical protein